MKYLLLYFITCITFGLTSTAQVINPTGTYELVSKTIKRVDDVYGAAGLIHVKEIAKKRIVVSFFKTYGAPGYNSGSFIDTLTLKDDIAIYRLKEDNLSCSITFKFTTKGIQVSQQSDYCGFGHGVYADGFYKKISSKVPIIKDALTGEVVK